MPWTKCRSALRPDGRTLATILQRGKEVRRTEASAIRRANVVFRRPSCTVVGANRRGPPIEGLSARGLGIADPPPAARDQTAPSGGRPPVGYKFRVSRLNRGMRRPPQRGRR